jgi:hypothetical protein
VLTDVPLLISRLLIGPLYSPVIRDLEKEADALFASSGADADISRPTGRLQVDPLAETEI